MRPALMVPMAEDTKIMRSSLGAVYKPIPLVAGPAGGSGAARAAPLVGSR